MYYSNELSQFLRNLKTFHDQGLLPSHSGETHNPSAPPTQRPLEDGTKEEEKQDKKRWEVRHEPTHRKKNRWSKSPFGKSPASTWFLLSTCTYTHTQPLVRCGYVVGLSGLLTGLPPFITAGSLVLLLGGTAALGTVSPTSCNDGSLYMATSNGLGRK